MKKKRVACIFVTAPYGGIVSREGLDVVLSLSVLSDNIGVFFISDGVFFLFSTQDYSKQSLVKNFISSFELLFLCGVQSMYLCSDSAFSRGISEKTVNSISKQIIWLSLKDWRKKLSCYDLIFSF